MPSTLLRAARQRVEAFHALELEVPHLTERLARAEAALTDGEEEACVQLCEEIEMLSRIVRNEVARAIGQQLAPDPSEDPLTDQIDARIAATLRAGQGREVLRRQLDAVLGEFRSGLERTLLERVDEHTAGVLDQSAAKTELSEALIEAVIGRLVPVLDGAFERIARSDRGRDAMLAALEGSKGALVGAIRAQIDAEGGVHMGSVRDEITRALEVYDDIARGRASQVDAESLARSEAFRELVDERFRAMVKYLQTDILPKVIADVLAKR